jgi:predicted nucleic acid-binding protein
LEYGARKSAAVEENLSALHQFTIPFDILPFDYNATVEYGIIRADLELKGTAPDARMDIIGIFNFIAGCRLQLSNLFVADMNKIVDFLNRYLLNSQTAK